MTNKKNDLFCLTSYKEVNDKIIKVYCGLGHSYNLKKSRWNKGKKNKCKSCSQVNDLRNKTINNLYVLDIDYEKTKKNKGKGKIFWKCQCKCGNFLTVRSDDITSGSTKRCWNCKVEKAKIKDKFSQRIYSRIIKSATSRNIKVAKNLSKKYLENLFEKQGGKCALSGIPIDFIRFENSGERRRKTASLDRINNDKGYVIGNLQWVHKDINFMKNKLSEDRFFYLCNKVVEHNKKNVN